MSSSSTQPSNVCFNSNCKEVSELPRKGWRRRTGEFADLCDRCASAYEEGKFCETFHLNASGWRSCESCGKQIHCGCIVSFHTFVLLDAGGIECITCARKSFILTPNPAWPPPSDFLPLQPEGIKDSRSWTPIAGSGPVPWRQAPSLFNGSVIQTKLQPKTPYGDITGSIDRLHLNERPPVSSLVNKRKEENFGSLLNRTLKSCVSGRLENEHTGFSCSEQSNSFLSGTQQTSLSKIDFSAPNFRLTVSSTPKKEASDRSKVFATHIQPTTLSPSVGKQSCSQNGTDSSGEAQMRNVRSRGDGGGKHQLLPRYWPRITDQELQQISGDTNSVITPLFEKMLSASDAGKIGRLVLPKKCAEAYFPPISHPEGLPLKVQDLKGQEWLFQFRFWPNNNSRMYVLEGVTPCMQSMQLQAGDIVTFSRIEPEGKLVMGCRKSSSTPSAHQGYGTSNSPIGVPTNGNASTKNIKPGEIVTKCSIKAKEVVETKPPVRSKRKNSTSNSKSKRLKVDCEELIELKLTVVQAQQLMRPSPNDTPTVIVIEGCDFEEYEQDAPIIGRPTIPSTGSLGEKIQWVQCEDCFKWRKIPDDALLPGRWTCSENLWDPDRSVCSAVEELTVECLADLVPTIGKAPKKMKASKQDMNSPDTIEGLDALANLAIQEEGEGVLASSSQATTKHPRHRPGCTCIVCIQPPSGKGPKHKQQCDCNVCKSVKRRFKTLMMKKGKKLSEKEAEAAANVNSPCSDAGAFSPTHEEPNSESCLDDTNDIIEKKSSPSPIKGEIDLNIKPEREDLSPRCDSGGVMRFLQDAAERFIWQQRGLPSSFANGNPVGHEVQDHVNLNNCGSDGSHQTSDADRHMALSIDNVSSVVHAEK
ncbi:PREDICTED: B3 domain-containing protein Os07g0563300 isoform X2 [Ipomoea nil]|uniref:B3 domain-containing protein Os07g0563300 isoform X2 n=1 Tax=Ipomoea nil TaxID=35883 RepID=UPI0009013C9E|nr:PREDICTED: B3 domain-containing protein Os07g0563300 isoform X2 [Ipomoea nil]